MNLLESASVRPYLIRALHEWCCDQGLTPHLVVLADGSVQVPREYVQEGQIVLNIGTEATSGLTLGNDCIHFKARFGGVPREVMVPMDRVLAIYARENGQGMAFPVLTSELEPVEPMATDDMPDEPAVSGPGIQLVSEGPSSQPDAGEPGQTPPAPKRKRPALKRIK